VYITTELRCNIGAACSDESAGVAIIIYTYILHIKYILQMYVHTHTHMYILWISCIHIHRISMHISARCSEESAGV